MKSIMSFFCVLFLFLVFSNNVFGQIYGKLFTAQEANTLFGPVLSSVKVPTEEVKSMMKETKNILLFRINGAKVEYVNNERINIFDKTINYDKSIVFKVVSLAVLEDLFIKGNKAETYFEIRKDVVSITNGAVTLERMTGCPPFCLE